MIYRVTDNLSVDVGSELVVLGVELVVSERDD